MSVSLCRKGHEAIKDPMLNKASDSGSRGFMVLNSLSVCQRELFTSRCWTLDTKLIACEWIQRSNLTHKTLLWPVSACRGTQTPFVIPLSPSQSVPLSCFQPQHTCLGSLEDHHIWYRRTDVKCSERGGSSVLPVFVSVAEECLCSEGLSRGHMGVLSLPSQCQDRGWQSCQAPTLKT